MNVISKHAPSHLKLILQVDVDVNKPNNAGGLVVFLSTANTRGIG